MNVNAKFRGKTADGKWVYGYLVKFIMEDGLEKHFIINENLRFHWDTFLYNILIEVRPETVGQWTGLKDKNGQEIYEGDYLKDIGLVSFDKGGIFTGKVLLYNFSIGELEVIDTPEILENK